VLEDCYRSFRNNGRLGIQAALKKIFCPNFIHAIKKVEKDLRTAKALLFLKIPGLSLSPPEEYKLLVKRTEFKVIFSKNRYR